MKSLIKNENDKILQSKEKDKILLTCKMHGYVRR